MALTWSSHLRDRLIWTPKPWLQNSRTIATSIVHSKLDYCNSLYHNLPNCQLNLLQQIQNSIARAVVMAPKSSHITPILKSLHWLKVNDRIEHKLLSLTKFLQLLNLAIFTTLSLFNLLAVPAPVVTPSRPPTISSLKITDRSFSYASPRLRNQLPDSFRQPHHSRLDSPPHLLLNSSLSSSPLSSSIIPSIFHSRLKTYLFNKSFPQYISITGLDRTYHAHHFIFYLTF